MLDARIHTFLELCRLKNYTRTAETLHITQPAVTQHIKHLEQELQTPLFKRDSRKLALTPKGEAFYWRAAAMEADTKKIFEMMKQPDPVIRRIKFGVSLSIGEYMMPQILSEYLHSYPDHKLEMIVENTDTLMKKLDLGEIDFAIIEGGFDSKAYSYVFFSRERFVAVCAADFPMADRALTMEDLIQYPFIIREKGSGTRMILENILIEQNLSLEQFKWVSEIGNFKTIKYLVEKKLGITFLYEPVVKEELKTGCFREVKIQGFDVMREFNFVYLKNSIFEQDYLDFYHYCREITAK